MWKNRGGFSCTIMIFIFNLWISPAGWFDTTHCRIFCWEVLHVWNAYWSQYVFAISGNGTIRRLIKSVAGQLQHSIIKVDYVSWKSCMRASYTSAVKKMEGLKVRHVCLLRLSLKKKRNNTGKNNIYWIVKWEAKRLGIQHTHTSFLSFVHINQTGE